MAKHPKRPQQLPDLPKQRVKVLTEPLARFMRVEAAGGVVLLVCTIAALVLANSPASDAFLRIWKTEIHFEIEGVFKSNYPHITVKHLINDGLMAIFFFVIGLEVKREIVLGELREIRRAALPIAAALGGMIIPAGLYMACIAMQEDQSAMRGWGIPMATDIAFVVGCMALLGPRVPKSLRVMLLSLAIVDDIGAILVIALGYTDPEKLSMTWLFWGFGGLGLCFLLGRMGVRHLFAYIVIGFFVWLAFHESGVHATIAGVLLGLLTPARSWVSEGLFNDIVQRANDVFTGDLPEEQKIGAALHVKEAAREAVPPLERIEMALHPWVGFFIMPVFALANAGVQINVSALMSPVAIAVMVGLVFGKPLGVMLASWVAVTSGIAKLPDRVSWKAIAGGGMLAGIGFTMALFIAGLAFYGDEYKETLDQAKIGILAGSTVAAILGMGLLMMALPKAEAET